MCRMLRMAGVTAMASLGCACGQVYTPPDAPYSHLQTVLDVLTPYGTRTTTIKANIEGQMVQTYPDTYGGPTNHFGPMTTDVQGNYYVVRPFFNASWTITWFTWPCNFDTSAPFLMQDVIVHEVVCVTSRVVVVLCLAAHWDSLPTARQFTPEGWISCARRTTVSE